MAQILTLGELLIDLTQSGTDEQGNGLFTAFPGGAPANVAVAAKRLGAETGFLGKVGRDAFGRSLAAVLEKEGVDTAGLYESVETPTTLAIVSVDKSGERTFSFYRNPGADTQLTEDEAVTALEKHINSDDAPSILHFGSLSMTTSPSREACEAAALFARKNGMLISYDPNYRAALWDSEENAIAMMKKLLPLADILKVSDEEMLMLTETEDFSEGSSVLADYGISLVMVTLGSDGVYVKCGDYEETVPGYSVKVADTNGAGDTFLGAMLEQIASEINRSGRDARDVLQDIESERLRKFVRYANRAASLTCSRHGAIPAMPHADELTEGLQSEPR